MRSLVRACRLVAVGIILTTAGAPPPAGAQLTDRDGDGVIECCERGDILCGVGAGQVEQRNPNTGALIRTLNTTSGSSHETGMCFNTAGDLHATNWTAGNMTKFDLHSSPVTTSSCGTVMTHPFAGPFSVHPEDCVFNAAGDILVGEVDGLNRLQKFTPSGTPLQSWNPTTGPRGLDWFDLAADQCTVFYTSEGSAVKRFDICANAGLGQQLTDLTASLPGPCFAVRVLGPPRAGDILVTCATAAFRLNSAGAVTHTYPRAACSGAISQLFAMNLDPNNQTFWTADYSSGTVCEFNIDTDAQLRTISCPPLSDNAGLAVCGEITASQPEQCGDHIVQPGLGEDCDPPGSACGAFICDGSCHCPTGDCGNGIIDPGEECDPPGSACGAFTCDASCQCPAGDCGNGIIDAGEECDPPGSACGAFTCDANCQCPTPACGNGVVDPGETCDPPNASLDAFGRVICRADCTRCGDAVVQGNANCTGVGTPYSCCTGPTTGTCETCDDGNTNQGCVHDGHPHNNSSVDGCQNNCTLHMCNDPARITSGPPIDVFFVHGLLLDLDGTSPLDRTFSVSLTGPGGVVFTAALPAGALKSTTRRFAYRDSAAMRTGGIAYLNIRKVARRTSYRATLRAYGDLSGASSPMTTHLSLGNQEWTVTGDWTRTRSGWRLIEE